MLFTMFGCKPRLQWKCFSVHKLTTSQTVIAMEIVIHMSFKKAPCSSHMAASYTCCRFLTTDSATIKGAASSRKAGPPSVLRIKARLTSGAVLWSRKRTLWSILEQALVVSAIIHSWIRFHCFGGRKKQYQCNWRILCQLLPVPRKCLVILQMGQIQHWDRLQFHHPRVKCCIFHQWRNIHRWWGFYLSEQ